MGAPREAQAATLHRTLDGSGGGWAGGCGAAGAAQHGLRQAVGDAAWDGEAAAAGSLGMLLLLEQLGAGGRGERAMRGYNAMHALWE